MLETDRLILRCVRSGDCESFGRIFSDAEVMRHVGYGRPLTVEEVAAMIERIAARFAADGFGQLAVERREDARVIGRVGLLPLDPTTWQFAARADIGPEAEIEIGWTLAREAWGCGYALESAVAVRDWARDELRLQRLVSIIQAGNDRSVRLANKLGAGYERDIVTAFGKRAHLYAINFGGSGDGAGGGRTSGR